MAASGVDLLPAFAKTLRFGEATLIVDLLDGRTLSVPVPWYPRLAHATPAQRETWELIGKGEGIHWPDLDEDVSMESLLAGRAPGESPESLRRWLERRQSGGRAPTAEGNAPPD